MADLTNLTEDDLEPLKLDQLLAIRDLINTKMDALLDQEQERVDQVIKQEQEKFEQLRTKVYGSTSKDPSSKDSSKKRTRKPPKYRLPTEHRKTWTGDGKQPEWVKEQLAAGKDLEEFRIQPNNEGQA